MGWLARLILGSPRAPERVEHLEINVESLTIGGLGRGDSHSLIEQRFGPPDSYWALRRGSYRYRALGLVFYCNKEGKVDCFSAYGPGAGTAFGSFPGRWLPEPAGGALPDEDYFIGLFGEPSARYDDFPEGPTLEWTPEGAEIYVDLDQEGRLSEFGVA